jgi:uncharacterized protein (TIGR02271 family)
MATTERTTVVGAFDNRQDAEKAVEELHRAGFRDDQIGFATRGAESDIGEPESKAGEGAAGGLLTGGVIGGILGALAAGLIPGIGPVIAGGILAGVLGGAAVGAAAGGLIGALMGMGVPEEEASYYNREFESGRTIVTVKADGRYDEARAILQRYGVLEYGAQPAMGTMGTMGTTRREEMRETRPTTRQEEVRETRPSGTRMADTDRDRTMELREEELRATKRPVEAGEVEIRKDVVSQQRSIDVPVTHEEVTIERHPVDRRPADRPIDEGETIEVPVRAEEVDVEKRAVVYEEVEIGKRPVTETQRVSDTVRREEVRMDREGDVDIGGGMTGRGFRHWDEVGPTHRQEWERRYGSSGMRWDDVEPYRRYGYEMANDPRYHDRDWNDLEPELRSGYSDWSRRYNYRSDESGWDRFRDQARSSWEEARARV